MGKEENQTKRKSGKPGVQKESCFRIPEMQNHIEESAGLDE